MSCPAATRGLQPSLPGLMLWCLLKLGLCLVSCTLCSPYKAAWHQSPSSVGLIFPQSPEASQVISGQAANKLSQTTVPASLLNLSCCCAPPIRLHSTLPCSNPVYICNSLWHKIHSTWLSPEALSPYPSVATSVLVVIRSLYALSWVYRVIMLSSLKGYRWYRNELGW